MIKKFHYSYLKPQNYYNRLMLFFILISFSLTLVYYRFGLIRSPESFILHFILILFLILVISAILEFKINSVYMGPLEIYDLEQFFLRFIYHVKKDKKLAKEKYLNKYDIKTNQKYDRIFKFSKKYFISSIRKKKDNNYEIIFINTNGYAIFFLFRFLAKKSVHRAIITKIKNHYKIIHLQ